MNNRIGILIHDQKGVNLREEFEKAKDLGLYSCHLCVWDPSVYTDDHAAELRQAITDTGFAVTALWAGWSGPRESDLAFGPYTVGLVPAAYRHRRLEELRHASDFAQKVGISTIATHVGYLPEDPHHPDYLGTLPALRWLCKYMKEKGQTFLFETGQETPTTLLRTIRAIDLDNVGVNFDTANLMMYGKGNALDSLEQLAPYVQEVHIKDGLYPTDSIHRGKEVPVGEGKANIPAILKLLDQIGYRGSLTIEREISGEQQIRDIVATKDKLLAWMGEISQ